MKLTTAIVDLHKRTSPVSYIIPRPVQWRGLLKHPDFPKASATTYPVTCLPAFDAPLCVIPLWLIKGLVLPEVGTLHDMHWPRFPELSTAQPTYEVLIELKEFGVAERVLAVSSPAEHGTRDPDTEIVLLGMSFFDRVLFLVSGRDRYATLEKQT